MKTSESIKRAYQYNLQDMNWSGTYLRSVLSSDGITKLLNITVLNSSWTEVFMSTMVIVMVYSYKALEYTLTHKKNRRWAYFPGENVSDLCASIVADA